MRYLPRLQHHFEDLPKQRHAAKLGMWLFLGSEVLFFSALFALYAAYRTIHLEIFQQGVMHNNLVLGTVNTAVLVGGSIFVSSAVNFLRLERRGLAVLLTSLTVLAGLTYIVIKTFEWGQHFNEGIFPGGRGPFFTENIAPGWAIFYNLYFGLTGLHIIHVAVGVALLGWMAWWIHRDAVTSQGAYKLALVGYYWHFVDMVWLFLWPLFYLLGKHP